MNRCLCLIYINSCILLSLEEKLDGCERVSEQPFRNSLVTTLKHPSNKPEDPRNHIARPPYIHDNSPRLTSVKSVKMVNFKVCQKNGDRRAVQAHSAEGKTSVTGANMSSYLTLLPKAESISPTEPSGNTIHISTQSKRQISASTGVSPGNQTACPRFHASSFIGGMMLAFIILLVVALGYRLACSQREVRYRVIEEHDAII